MKWQRKDLGPWANRAKREEPRTRGALSSLSQRIYKLTKSWAKREGDMHQEQNYATNSHMLMPREVRNKYALQTEEHSH